jgi:hypothetical protein
MHTSLPRIFGPEAVQTTDSDLAKDLDGLAIASR